MSTFPRLFALLLVLTCSLSVAGSAYAGERATMSWDTSDTDIDLHVWNAYGDHAYFSQKEDIPGAVLSTDITNGFGPEHLDEDFVGEDQEAYYYGICYYASHWSDGSVPATTVTVTVTDPNGTKRTFRRVLRAEKESYLLGASPSGSVSAPRSSFCGSRTARPETDQGDQTPSNPVLNANCGATTQRLGNVVICADESTGAGTRYTLKGNVRIDGSVLLGDGPIQVDTTSRLIWTDAVAPLSVQRADGSIVAVGSSPFSIDAAGVTDPLSGREGLAKIILGGFVPGAMQISGFTTLLGNPDLTGPAKVTGYIDSRDGGGVILGAQLELPLGKAKSDGAFAVGIHRNAPRAVTILSGKAEFKGFSIPGSPWTARLSLGYRADGDLWDAAGGITTPVIGVDVEGQLAGGQINAVGVTIKKDVLLGQTGIVISRLGGKVEGMVTPPLKLTGSIAGRWPSAPGVKISVLNLDDASLSFSSDLSAAFSGKYSLGYANSPIGGELKLGGKLDPFAISGSLENRIGLAQASLSGTYAAELTTSTFRATGSVKGKLLGADITGATAGLSEQGLGVVGSVCIPGFEGFRATSCARRAAIGASMRWDRFGHLDVGGDALKKIGIRNAVRAQAAPAAITVRAAGTEPMLVWQVDGIDAAMKVIGPGGRGGDGCSADRPSRTCQILPDPATNVTTVVVFSPKAGRWSVQSAVPTLAAADVQAVRAVRTVKRPTAANGGSAKKPLKRTTKTVKVSWGASRGQGKRVTVDVYVSATKGAVGTLFVADRKPAGNVRIPRSTFPAGGAYVRLVPKLDGIPSGELWTKKAIWVAP